MCLSKGSLAITAPKHVIDIVALRRWSGYVGNFVANAPRLAEVIRGSFDSLESACWDSGFVDRRHVGTVQRSRSRLQGLLPLATSALLKLSQIRKIEKPDKNNREAL